MIDLVTLIEMAAAPESVTFGWNYRPDTYRCDQGWNDDTGQHTYGCRDAGTREVDREWLCEYHAKRAEAELNTPIMCCPECRAIAHLPQPEPAPKQWYICLACDSEWHGDNPPPDAPVREPRNPVDVALAIAWIGFLLTSLMFVLYLWARNVVLHGHTGPDGHLAFEPGDLGALAVAGLSWVCAVTVISRIVATISDGMGRAARRIRGDEGQEA